jgi:hypothetical protein
MPFELFGMDTTTSIVLLLVIIWAAIVFVAIVVIVAVCCRWHTAGAAAAKPERPSEPSDRLIPPIFYTERLRDPLAQEDLFERTRLQIA